MGLLEFFILMVVVIVLAACAAWVIDYFAPSRPDIAVHLVWGVAILVILATLAQATGLLHYDPIIPRLR